MSLNKFLLAPLAISMAFALSACNDGSSDDDNGQPLSLKVLHINDHHSNLDDTGVTLTLDNQDTDARMGGFPRVVTKFNELVANSSHSNILKLHAGDAITGTSFYTLFEGEADAAMMNQICFDAMALGNHEFDAGDAGLVTFLDFLETGSCNTSVLAANVVPEEGVSPLAPAGNPQRYIQPYAIKEIDGQQVGIIGIDIAQKTKNSSNPDETTQFLDEMETAQSTIDGLKGQGINKIILLTHYQYSNDVELAQNLSGVDVIVGGDSHSLLGNTFAGLGLSPEGPYPTQQTNQDGDPVCIVQAWQYASVVGELNVEFDENGVVTSCNGTPHLLLGDTFEREDANGDDVELTGAYLAAVQADIDNIAELSIVEPDAETSTLLTNFSDQVDTLSAEVIGTAAVDLCLERIPGQGRSTIAGCNELTQARGSDISNIVAKGFLERSNTSDICIQNAGGVRIDVPMGDITIGTAYTLLPFGNTLIEIDMTGQQIVDVLEEAFRFATDPDGSTGAYPYAAGLRWDLDASQPFGQRFSNVEVNSRVAGSWTPISLNQNYRIVTNSFIAAGRDGYETFGNIPDSQKTDTFLDYAQSFVEYVRDETTAGRAVTRLPVEEYSTQSYTNMDGELQ